MARNYTRDRNGKFARTSGGGSARSRALSASNRRRAKEAADRTARNRSRAAKLRVGIAVVGAGALLYAANSKSSGTKVRAFPGPRPSRPAGGVPSLMLSAAKGKVKTPSTPTTRAAYGRTTIGPRGGATRPINASRKAVANGKKLYLRGGK